MKNILTFLLLISVSLHLNAETKKAEDLVECTVTDITQLSSLTDFLKPNFKAKKFELNLNDIQTEKDIKPVSIQLSDSLFIQLIGKSEVKSKSESKMAQINVNLLEFQDDAFKSLDHGILHLGTLKKIDSLGSVTEIGELGLNSSRGAGAYPINGILSYPPDYVRVGAKVVCQRSFKKMNYRTL